MQFCMCKEPVASDLPGSLPQRVQRDSSIKHVAVGSEMGMLSSSRSMSQAPACLTRRSASFRGLRSMTGCGNQSPEAAAGS